MQAQRIGRYEVLGELGTGGMAVVYRAHDPRLDRDVAVKVLHPHLARDPESRARFEREARAAARLRHPNIVEVYEFSGPDERDSYMVTELLEGPTLRRFIDRHPDVPAECAAAIGVVLCDALACAHAQGVVHRDVKPDNLMLQRGQLKLTDFGIAYLADGRGMTVTGQVLGSPAHMAPEQIEGADVDARTDVFATGTVLYLLAVGRLPFEGPTAHTLLRKILDGEFADPERVAPVVGHRFAAIIRRCLARKPEDRYASAEALREALCDFVKEVDWDFPAQELRRYFGEPEDFVATLRETLKARLPALGEAAQREGRTGDAMGYFNRALALDPGNAKVLRMVRGFARRRRVMRVARTAGIVGGAAALTAVAAVAVMRSQVPPKPTPTVVQVDRFDESAGVPTPVVVRTSERPPELLSVVDASVSAPAVAVRAHTPVSERGVRDPRDHHGAPNLPAVMAAVADVRVVELHPNPMNAEYSLDGHTWRAWDSRNPVIGSFPVGRRLRFWVRSLNPLYEQREWNAEIEAVPGTLSIPMTLRLRANAPAPDSTASLGDGGLPRVN